MNLKLLKALSEAFGPSGFEEDVVKIVKNNVPFCDIEIDAMNNVYLSLKSNTGNKPKLLLDAHLDEVGFMVQSVAKNGLISFVPLGGWVPTNVPAHTVHIKTETGELVQGIIASKPPHFMSEKEKSAPLELESLQIDIGASDRETVINVFGIQVGDPIAPHVIFNENSKSDFVFGKAFDNRMGCFAVIETLRLLSTIEELPYDVIGALASQEEVGTRGAHVTGQVTAPDMAIVFEGSPADDLYYDAQTAQCVLGSGVQIRHMDASYVSHRRLINFAKSLADAHEIPYQSAVRRKGGTNAGRLHTSGKAVPVLVLGVPSRYVHTHYNYASLKDVKATIDLAVKVATAPVQKLSID
ncbi:MAG: peptidase [Clostridiales bacterium 38-18]|nr:MAG: peptidase [Clostridiales bacterium 38-18]